MSDTQTHCSHRFIIVAGSAGTTGRRKSELKRKSVERTVEEEGRKTNWISQLAKICPASCCWRPINKLMLGTVMQHGLLAQTVAKT